MSEDSPDYVDGPTLLGTVVKAVFSRVPFVEVVDLREDQGESDA